MLKKFTSNTNDWVSKYKEKLLESREARKLTMCKSCYTFYYRNSWHFEIPTAFKKSSSEEEVPVLFTQCQACLEQEDSLYEAESNFALS